MVVVHFDSLLHKIVSSCIIFQKKGPKPGQKRSSSASQYSNIGIRRGESEGVIGKMTIVKIFKNGANMLQSWTAEIQNLNHSCFCRI
jgi:hypothetical protein